MLVTSPKVGDKIDVLYPVHGSRNILRGIVGVVVKQGVGPNGAFITVDSKNVFRSLSLKKIVSNL